MVLPLPAIISTNETEAIHNVYSVTSKDIIELRQDVNKEETKMQDVSIRV